MNIASLLILLLILVAVWYAMHTLRRNGGHSCRGCCDAHCCAKKQCNLK